MSSVFLLDTELHYLLKNAKTKQSFIFENYKLLLII